VQKSIHCLIIDDDLDDQEIFLMCVQEINKNIQCLTCNTGVDAISMLESDHSYIPEYIFIDVNMPKMNGITCLELLKNIEHLKHSKFYMYSTSADRSALEDSRKLGANDFIIKPVRKAELKEKLSMIFSNATTDYTK